MALKVDSLSNQTQKKNTKNKPIPISYYLFRNKETDELSGDLEGYLIKE